MLDNDVSCLGSDDPFTTTCLNSDHITEVLRAAGTAAALARMVNTEAVSALPDAREMLYALFALSVIGHVDRNTNGRCFKNDNSGTPYATAFEFCQSFIDADFDNVTLVPIAAPTCGGHPTQTTGTFDDTSYYICKNHELSTLDCTSDTDVGPPPPPPAFDFERPTNTLVSPTVGDAVLATCRNLLQYGLFDQTRLFGLPDIVEPFQVDARPNTWLAFLSSAIYNGLYVNPAEDGIFKDPVFQLELYLGYRMWATTIWGMLIASVTGYFMARAVIPFTVQVMAIMVRLRTHDGKSVTLARPPQDFSLLLASASCLLAGVWTLFVDPSTQAPYPVSTECKDWIDNTLHSGSGAYLTSWGKRRFTRYTENQLGLALLFLCVLPFLYASVSMLVDPRIIRNAKRRWLTSKTGAFWVVFICIAIMQILQMVQITYSANEWLLDATLGTDTTVHNLETSNDCVAGVMIAFWSSASAGSARNRWAVGNISGWQTSLLWGGGTIGALWVGILSYAAILPNELADALAYPTKDRQRQGTLVSIIVFATIASVAIAFGMLRSLLITEPGGNDADAKVASEKDQLESELNARRAQDSVAEETIEDYQYRRSMMEEPDLAPVRPFSFDLMKKPLAPPTGQRFSFRFTNAQLGADDQTGYTTALPPPSLFDSRRRKDEVQYIPMLKFQH